MIYVSVAQVQIVYVLQAWIGFQNLAGLVH